MKRYIFLFLVFVLVAATTKSYSYLTKYRHAQRLKIGVDSFSFPKLNLSSIFNEILVNVIIGVNNFSPSLFNLEQINVEVYSQSGDLVAEQKSPLLSPIKVQPNRYNTLPLTLLISSHNVAKLIKESGGTVSVGASYLTSGSYGIPLHLKGFVVAEGLSIAIDQTIQV